ncbi:MAG: aspartate aminotransferase family protein [Steroidobacteraceae bacterium]
MDSHGKFSGTRSLVDSRSEGDINLSPYRREWQATHIGSETRIVLDADAKYFLHQSLSTPCLDVLAEADGIYLVDVDGRRFMDFHGNNLHQVGYRNPRVMAAVHSALDTLPFSPRRFTNHYAVDLAARLTALAPGDLDKVLLAPGGAEAIGMALKLARVATGRHKTVSMWDSFHGASLDAISIGGEALFRKNIGPLLPGSEHAPPCDPRACLYGCAGTCNARCADYVEYILDKEEDVAAVIVETVRCTDVQIPPLEYYKRVRASCDRHGTLLILDEIPIGIGRTGYMFAFEHYGIVPDMVVLGKGLGGAVWPMAALIVRGHLNIAGGQALGHYTHEKSSVGCAAALATLACLEEDGLLERANAIGARMMVRLEALKARVPLVCDVRGLGALVGVELALPDGQPACDAAERVMYACLSNGLSFKIGQGNVLNLSPPLITSDAQLDSALSILEHALIRVAASS